MKKNPVDTIIGEGGKGVDRNNAAIRGKRGSSAVPSLAFPS